MQPPRVKRQPAFEPAIPSIPAWIELHNHLCYDAMPLGTCPKSTPTTASGRITDSRRPDNKTLPGAGPHGRVVEAIGALCQMPHCLLGGVTASQRDHVSSRELAGSTTRGSMPMSTHTKIPRASTKIPNPRHRRCRNSNPSALCRPGISSIFLSEGTDQTCPGVVSTG